MDFFKRLSGKRVFTEIRLILEEENPTPAIVRLHDFDLLQTIHPSIVLNDELQTLLNAVTNTIAWHDLLFVEESYLRWAVYFMVLIRGCDLSTSEEVCRRMELAPKHVQLLCEERLGAQYRLSRLEQRLPHNPGQLFRQLDGLRTELILYMMATTQFKSVKKAISGYYNQLRTVHPIIGGEDLKALGLKPGPLFRQILETVRDAKLNGEVKTREDELNLVRRWIETAPSLPPRLNKILDSEKTSR
jgi:tRNA nucleotidyltransferase (CCA-adding enzyme)